MELCLSLGDEAPEKPRDHQAIMTSKTAGLCINLSIGPSSCGTSTSPTYDADDHQASSTSSKLEVPVQLDLLPHTPVVFPRSSSSSRRFPWPTPCDRNGGGGCSSEAGGLDVNRGEEVAAESSSPTNSGASSFHMDIGIYRSNYIGRGGGGDRTNYNYSRDIDQGADQGDEAERASNNSRGSDEDDIINGNASRKKLRLSKEQSAFLEESFKEHHTLNPKQKLALAKQLNLRPRQVEVWFQNRRARTKLKQTEVDCEFLKRCCETLTEENRRLHKELQELRALKTHHHSNPFYMQSPATTLTMCPSCERTATTTNTNTNTNKTTTNNININNSIYRPN